MGRQSIKDEAQTIVTGEVNCFLAFERLREFSVEGSNVLLFLLNVTRYQRLLRQHLQSLLTCCHVLTVTYADKTVRDD